MECQTIYGENKKGFGEDAPPIAEAVPSGGTLLAVFDGMGGAGMHSFIQKDASGETKRTAAYLGARFARKAVQNYFAKAKTVADPAEEQSGLIGTLVKVLGRGQAELHPVASTIASGSRRELPSTGAIARFLPADGELPACRLYWAGDARIYLFSCDQGLQLLTFDHIRNDAKRTPEALVEAIASGEHDFALANVISADERFYLDSREIPLPPQSFIFCVTDGVYELFNNPRDFESAIISLIKNAPTAEAFTETLRHNCEQHKRDDYSAAFAFVTPYSELRAALKNPEMPPAWLSCPQADWTKKFIQPAGDFFLQKKERDARPPSPLPPTSSPSPNPAAAKAISNIRRSMHVLWLAVLALCATAAYGAHLYLAQLNSSRAVKADSRIQTSNLLASLGEQRGRLEKLGKTVELLDARLQQSEKTSTSQDAKLNALATQMDSVSKSLEATGAAIKQLEFLITELKSKNTSSPNPPKETPSAPAAPPNAPIDIKAVQLRLIELGCMQGKADGVSGAGTKNAIRRFEEVNGLKVTGLPSQQLLDAFSGKPKRCS